MNRALVLAALLAACTPAPTVTPSANSSPPSSIARPSVLPTAPPTELDDVTVRQPSWRPTGLTAVVATYNLTDTTIVAVPLDAPVPTNLIEARRRLGDIPALWDVAPGGSALVLAVTVGTTTSRLASVDLGHGTKAWLTVSPQMLTTPAFSSDGRSVLYASYTSSGDDGVTRVALDGSALTAARPPTTAFGSLSSVRFETRDGVLAGADEFNGPTAFLRDLATGRERSFGAHYSNVEAWRAVRPRALVSVYTRIDAPGAGYLALWDDVDGSAETILNRPVSGADFDPAGVRIVAAAISEGTSRLVLLPGPLAKVIPDSEGASWPRWTATGIVYTVNRPTGSELRIYSFTDGSTTVLLRSAGQMSSAKIVSP